MLQYIDSDLTENINDKQHWPVQSRTGNSCNTSSVSVTSFPCLRETGQDEFLTGNAAIFTRLHVHVYDEFGSWTRKPRTPVPNSLLGGFLVKFPRNNL